MTTSIDDQYITKSFCYKVCVPGFTFFEIVLNQHWRRRSESHKISWNPRIIWRYHLERASFPHLPYRYSAGKLGNITTIILLIRLHFYDLHDRGFLSIRHRASVLTIDFSFQHISTWQLGFRGVSGFGRIEVICISDNDGSACTGSEIPYGCIAHFRLRFICLYYPKMLHVRLADICSSHVITHHLGVLHAESPTRLRLLLLVIITYSSR